MPFCVHLILEENLTNVIFIKLIFNLFLQIFNYNFHFKCHFFLKPSLILCLPLIPLSFINDSKEQRLIYEQRMRPVTHSSKQFASKRLETFGGVPKGGRVRR